VPSDGHVQSEGVNQPEKRQRCAIDEARRNMAITKETASAALPHTRTQRTGFANANKDPVALCGFSPSRSASCSASAAPWAGIWIAAGVAVSLAVMSPGVGRARGATGGGGDFWPGREGLEEAVGGVVVVGLRAMVRDGSMRS
jgi:hypothetical protein